MALTSDAVGLLFPIPRPVAGYFFAPFSSQRAATQAAPVVRDARRRSTISSVPNLPFLIPAGTLAKPPVASSVPLVLPTAPALLPVAPATDTPGRRLSFAVMPWIDSARRFDSWRRKPVALRQRAHSIPEAGRLFTAADEAS